MPHIEWALRHIEVDGSGCWIWQRHRTPRGYGYISVNGRMVFVHRLTYTELVGPIPDGLVIDHKCRVTSCCNPLHLRAVTQRVNTTENVADTVGWKLNQSKTHCPQGHAYEGRNLVAKRGKRHCRECELARSRDYHRRHAQQIRARKSAYREAQRISRLSTGETNNNQEKAQAS
jgi:hypothetical protein